MGLNLRIEVSLAEIAAIIRATCHTTEARVDEATDKIATYLAERFRVPAGEGKVN